MIQNPMKIQYLFGIVVSTLWHSLEQIFSNLLSVIGWSSSENLYY